MKQTLFVTLAALLALTSCGGGKKITTIEDIDPAKPVHVTYHTSMGDVTVLLYDDTPLHRDNTIRLCLDGVYDSVQFHRIIKDFLAQGGDPDSRRHEPGVRYGGNGGGYNVPAEILPQYFCKRGALIDAKQGDDVNPGRESAGTQFCFVQGRVFTDEELDRTEERLNAGQKNWYYHRNLAQLKRDRPELDADAMSEQAMLLAGEQIAAEGPVTIPAGHREVYKTIGGTPHLDGSVTIWGEVVEGLDVVERMTLVETDREAPVTPVYIVSTTVFQK